MLLGYGLSCLTDRSDRHKNLLLTANLNILTRIAELLISSEATLETKWPHLYTAPESQKHIQNDKFSATVRTCSVTNYGSIKCKTSLSNVCTFGIDYPVHACNQRRPQKFLTGHVQSSYR